MATLNKEKLLQDLTDMANWADPLAGMAGGDDAVYGNTFQAWHAGAINGNVEAIQLVIDSLERGEYDVENA